MKVKSVKLLLDSCAETSHIEQLLPPLPPGVTPRCVRVIEQVAILSRQNKPVRVSDISEMLDVTRPGITAVLRELTAMEYVVKSRDDSDSRVVYVALTDKGRELYRTIVTDYHAHLAEVLAEIGDEGAETLSRIIHRVMALIAQDTQKRFKNQSESEMN